ncbi:hypothetical protein PRIPAC_89588 [Pristionchus pacificus]|uniref:Uncharacterized protein n=1 Tax=Pristionchus pacificus TaxID=54126 RepID=A0A2A6B3I6_PRIPA|nr:hypothetical protein PRIPAC_89588 [Pristionchus pacificus]|eukprot:PDM60446.1 hypothetical protein PRIPAC_53424 [Pristionchus pacificus]
MIFYSLFIFFFSTFCVSSLAVSSFHLSQFLGVLPVTDLAVLLEVSANLIRQIISLTFLVMSLSGLGLACCTFIFVINQTSKNREIESFFRRFGLANTRFKRRRHHFQMLNSRPISLPFPLIFLLLLLCIFTIITIVLATFIGLFPTETRITILSLVPLVHAFQFIICSVLCVIFYKILSAIRDVDNRLITVEMNRQAEILGCYSNPNHSKISESRDHTFSTGSSVCEAPGVVFR